MNHVSGRLADFPKTFGLTELKKGYFPHYFNTPENKNYVGPIPDIKYYSPDQMSPKDREVFLKWHQTQISRGFVFDFTKELRAYCRSDVDILRRRMVQFREKFIESSNIDPLQYVTNASVCMTIMRSGFLKTKEVAVVKDTTRQENFSKVSIKWLDYMSETTKTTIEHALNGGEYLIEGVGRVDGYCEATNTAYEFQGCFWHGCSTCCSGDTINTRNQIDMAELNKRTLAKNKKIEELGYNLVTVYECELTQDFKKWDKANPREFVGPLNPRDSFFGGRTNVSKLKYDFKEGEKGQYVDYVSLYPTVQYFKRYSVGHPNKITDPSLLKKFDKEWFGLIKCNVELLKSYCFHYAELALRVNNKNVGNTLQRREASLGRGVPLKS